MHHSLPRIYSRNREKFLQAFMFFAAWTRLPLAGKLVRNVANSYGKSASGAYLLTLKEAQEIVDGSQGLALGPCSCRKVFKNCDGPINAEIMLSMGSNVFIEQRPAEYQQINKEQASALLEDCHQRGLIHTIVKCRDDFYAICNCCSCCCVPLRLSKRYGIGNALVRDANIVEMVRDSAETPHTHSQKTVAQASRL
ncbi:MAG: hypothetical protein A2147_09790 [Chloroflexi bacterium RBG_16_57_8]|nr:MAG: hypothetical protein A2147_09790 [Chloroflexi bacterium RBG_16_57_8]